MQFAIPTLRKKTVLCTPPRLVWYFTQVSLNYIEANLLSPPPGLLLLFKIFSDDTWKKIPVRYNFRRNSYSIPYRPHWLIPIITQPGNADSTTVSVCASSTIVINTQPGPEFRFAELDYIWKPKNNRTQTKINDKLGAYSWTVDQHKCCFLVHDWFIHICLKYKGQ